VKSQSFLAISEADYDFVVDVNLKGAFNLCRAAVEHFVAHQTGSIVNVASVDAMANPMIGDIIPQTQSGESNHFS
jgi:NAD(P)-dependent dehydrogenase (short-subunit alcohol dehydrogenase family)